MELRVLPRVEVPRPGVRAPQALERAWEQVWPTEPIWKQVRGLLSLALVLLWR